MPDFASQTSLLLAMSWREKIATASWLELVLWIGLAVLTLALLVLVGTRWGQVRPVSKCVVLSVFAHLLFLFYAYGTSLSFQNGSLEGDPFVRVSFLTAGESDYFADSAPQAESAAMPNEAVTENSTASPAEPLEQDASPPASDPATPPAMAPDFARATEPAPDVKLPPALLPAPTPPPPPLPAANSQAADEPEDKPARNPTVDESAPVTAQVDSPEAARSADSTASSSVKPTEPTQRSQNSSAVSSSVPAQSSRDDAMRESQPTQEVVAKAPAAVVRPIDGQPVPDAYQMRVSPQRLRFAISFGANESTEAAVIAALEWLAAQQEQDGRWDASEFGAGRETRTLGQDRHSAGADADTGISGLALLAFLGSGHTHIEGEYRETVQRGLEFVMRSQLKDGSLVGGAKDFEKMYCHGIALIALGEAYAMTGDTRLLPALRRGVQYTLAAQDRTSGGWRYQPGDRGDMSQCGWQVMALRSAELGGLEIPAETRKGMSRFLDSVKQGVHGGLASYRPGERATRTMTAEAMVCRGFLDAPAPSAASKEASDFLLRELPGQDEPNLYYWYYATLCLFQGQGEAWEEWNRALQRHLLKRQIREGQLAGSWDTRDVWGGYGGRVYTTAMAALCLEVYYRYLPIYDPSNSVRHADAIRAPEAVRR